MEQLNKNKIWALILLVLVLANLATLGIFWYMRLKNTRQNVEENRQSGTSKFVIDQLGFDSGQQNTYLKLIHNHQNNVREINEKLRMTKDGFFNLLSDSSVKQQSIDSISNQIGLLEKQIDIQTFKHFQQVRAMCKPDQKLKFDNIIRQILRMMGPSPGGRPQGPPPQGGQGEAGGAFPPPPPDGQGPPPR